MSKVDHFRTAGASVLFWLPGDAPRTLMVRSHWMLHPLPVDEMVSSFEKWPATYRHFQRDVFLNRPPVGGARLRDLHWKAAIYELWQMRRAVNRGDWAESERAGFRFLVHWEGRYWTKWQALRQQRSLSGRAGAAARRALLEAEIPVIRARCEDLVRKHPHRLLLALVADVKAATGAPEPFIRRVCSDLLPRPSRGQKTRE